MTTTGNNAKVHTEVVPVQRGPRYYLLLLLLFAWGILFLFTASTALTQLSLPAFLAAVVLLYLGLVLRKVYRSLNPMRTPVLTTPLNQLEVAFEDVVFSSRDGWMLSGWFIPSRKGPTVILTYGIGGNRLDLMPAASLLIEHGFGVLMYDLGAHGRSTGNLSTGGWLEVNDLNGAADYLLSRPDVDPNRIGALGFSLGGQITIRADAENNTIKAVIAEDLSPSVLADHSISSGFSLRNLYNYPGLWLIYTLQSFASGVAPPAGVQESIYKIAPRPILLISSERGRGPDLIRAYYDAAGYPKDLWEVPERDHGWISSIKTDEYQEKIITFFNHLLLEDELLEYTLWFVSKTIIVSKPIACDIVPST